MGQLKYWNTATSTWDSVDVGGEGVPNGGTTGQYLRKSSSTDYDTAWDTINLGTDTEGNYVASVAAGNGISVSGTAGEGYTATVATKFVGVFGYRSSNLSIANNTFTVSVNFNAEDYDTDAFHSTSTNTTRFTVPTGLAGKYLVTASLSYAANATGIRACYINRNSNGTITTFAGNIYDNVGSILSTTVSASAIVDLAEADFIEIEAYQNSGAALNVLSGRSSFCALAYLGA
jgi:hypothetical protein